MADIFERFADNILRLTEENIALESASRTRPSGRAPGMSPGQTAAASAARPITNPAQIIIPAIDWNWPNVPAESISDDQFQFADSIPQSVISGREYTSSSDSYASGYDTFLKMIDASKFPLPSMLTKAIKINKKPTIPLTETAPDGWTKVEINGVERWKPLWQTSDTATEWFEKVQTGIIANPGSFTLDFDSSDRSSPILTEGNNEIPGTQSQFDSVTISAECWGQISVSPGDWFNSTIITLGRDCVPNPSIFFGENGLLRGRVSSFLVAYKAKFKFNAPSNVEDALANVLSESSDLRAMGVPVKLNSTNGNAGSTNTVSMTSINMGPVIVVAMIET